jgi:hypothetical protein
VVHTIQVEVEAPVEQAAHGEVEGVEGVSGGGGAGVSGDSAEYNVEEDVGEDDNAEEVEEEGTKEQGRQ